jgi:hypothetical protein
MYRRRAPQELRVKRHLGTLLPAGFVPGIDLAIAAEMDDSFLPRSPLMPPEPFAKLLEHLRREFVDGLLYSLRLRRRFGTVTNEIADISSPCNLSRLPARSQRIPGKTA